MPELFKSCCCDFAHIAAFLMTMKQETIEFVRERIAFGLSSKQMTSAWEDIQERLIDDKLASHRQAEPEFVGTHIGNRSFECVAYIVFD